MDEKLYTRLKAKLDLDRQAADEAYKAATAKHEALLKSLNDVWALANEDSSPPMSIRNHDDAVNFVRGVWKQVAHQIITEMPSDKQFTGRQVLEAIATRNPDLRIDPVSVLGYLKKLVSDKKIEVVIQGRGSNPTVFKKCFVNSTSTTEKNSVLINS
jgi:hypothetical protein